MEATRDILGNPRRRFQNETLPRNPRIEDKHICDRTDADKMANWLEQRFDSFNDDFRKFFFIAGKILSKERIMELVTLAFRPWIKNPRAYFIRSVQGTPEYKNYIKQKQQM